MTQEIIKSLIVTGITFCITFYITFSIFRIRRLQREKESYEKQLIELKTRIQPPKIIKETVPLSVIEARQYVPAEQYLRLPPDAVKRDMERLLSVKIGEKIVESCGVRKDYLADTDTYCFRVAVEVTGRSFKKEDENVKTEYDK